MESRFRLTKNHKNVSIIIGVKPKFYAYPLLILSFGFLPLPFLFQIVFTFENLLLLLIFYILIISFPIKYMLWNVFGKERLIITAKSISYNYDFGFISSNFKTIVFQNFVIQFEETLADEIITVGKIYFYEIDQITDLPKLIHNTSLRISEENFDLLIEEINSLFQFDTFSLN